MAERIVVSNAGLYPMGFCDLVEIPSTTFLMGDLYGDGFAQERPVHEVRVDNFHIAKYCVTVREYFEFMVSEGEVFQEVWCDYINPCFVLRRRQGYQMVSGADNFPMCQVNLTGTMAYCNWLSVQHDLEPVYDLGSLEGDLGRNGFRLPTEAEWEFACGGPSRLKYSTCAEFDPKLFNHKNYAGDRKHLQANANKLGGFCLDPGPMPVGSLPPNEIGLHEMLGNVREWCNDRYLPYSCEKQKCPRGGRGGFFQVVRGGSFIDDRRELRTSYRYAVHHDTKCMVYGFRLARNAI